MINTKQIITILIGILFINTSCEPDAEVGIPVDEQIGSLPTFIIDPADNPRTPEKVELGRLLFWDPILSGNNDVACATCHHPDNDYAERIDLSIGVGGHGLSEGRTGGVLVRRNAQTILNTAFNGIDENWDYDPLNTVGFWDNRVASLEEQSLQPIRSMDEMRGNVYSAQEAIAVVSQRLANIPEYVQRFNNVFGDGTLIDGDKIAKAIAAFERTLIANNSPFDRYARGDTSAMNVQQIRGMTAFIDARCTACHSGPMFSDYELHDIGVPNNTKLSQVDNGVNGAFRTPTLRNLPNTGPFMHNGTSVTLADAVAFYDDQFEVNDQAAELLDFDADPEEIDAIVAFLEALNDPDFDRIIPESVPSGLPVGGNID